VNQRIIDVINTADSDIEVNTMLITRSDIGYALRDKAQAGVNTRVIVNSDGECTETVVNTLIGVLGANFREYGESGLLHTKAMIVDQSVTSSQPLVLTGSHNWSSSANDKNDENTLIIYDAEIANIYYQEFMARYNAGIPLAVNEMAAQAITFELFPNPTGDQVSIALPADVEGSVSLIIYDHTGRQVENRSFDPGRNGTFIMDLSRFKNGLYIVTLSEGKSVFSKKLVIAH
jgi:phosphatidylserine/phosphatidylglycerophosphate/cardiolipin synthase-like enzyme